VKLLLDENVPAPMTSTVKTLLRRSHDVQHVNDMPGWSGTKDLHFYGKAKDAGFEVVVTNDAKQMNRKLEVEAIAKSGWTTPSFLEAVISGKVGIHAITEAAPRRAAGTRSGDGL
jgi:predicted nuclease of predicted toxin-antitoxin system